MRIWVRDTLILSFCRKIFNIGSSNLGFEVLFLPHLQGFFVWSCHDSIRFPDASRSTHQRESRCSRLHGTGEGCRSQRTVRSHAPVSRGSANSEAWRHSSWSGSTVRSCLASWDDWALLEYGPYPVFPDRFPVCLKGNSPLNRRWRRWAFWRIPPLRVQAGPNLESPLVSKRGWCSWIKQFIYQTIF